jgi:two-component system sensor kinase FixL
MHLILLGWRVYVLPDRPAFIIGADFPKQQPHNYLDAARSVIRLVSHGDNRQHGQMNSLLASSASHELQALLDAAVDAIIIIDHRGRIELFNHAAERLFGYSPEEVMGRNVAMLMTERDSGAHDSYLERYQRTAIPHIIGIGREVDARRKDGNEFPVQLSVGKIAGADPPRYVGLLSDITLRRQALLSAQRERDTAARYLDTAQTILLAFDPEFRLSLLNRKGSEVLGYGEQELLGHDWLQRCIAPEDQAKARQGFAATLSGGGRPHYCECPVIGRAGDRRLIAWRCVALCDDQGNPNGVLASGEDITERRAADQALVHARELLDEAQVIARLGNFELYVPSSRSDYWSPTVYRLFGLPNDGSAVLSHDRVLALIHPDDREQYQQHWQAALDSAGVSYFVEYRVVLAGGVVRHLHSRIHVSEAGNDGKRVAGTVQDVTELRNAEQQVRQIQDRMTNVARLTTMGEMAAGIAHEINQPLTAITTFAQASMRLLRHDPPELEDVAEALAQMSAQALRAGEIIRRLRSLVRHQETQREPADINDLITELAGLVGADARLNSVRLRFELAEGLPRVSVDRIQIQQVLANLVRNAIEALEGIPASLREVVVRSTPMAESEVEVSVSDSGPGVSAELLQRMFDPFCTTKATGTGLGLSISRSIIHAHRGQLSYRSAPGGGACFYFRLPPD